MDYSLDELDALRVRIEAEGGKLLDRLCDKVSTHHFPDPKLSKVSDLLGARGVRPKSTLTQKGCGNHTLFEIPYIVQSPDVRTRTPLIRGTIVLCAVCDNLGDRPRFKEA
jgi:hypothetical protein